MTHFIFRNRWIALIWAVSTLASIALFVTRGGGSDKVESAVSQIRAQRASIEAQQNPALAAEQDARRDDGFTPDEDLAPGDETAQPAAAGDAPVLVGPASNPDE
jgi:hypothetical protein